MRPGNDNMFDIKLHLKNMVASGAFSRAPQRRPKSHGNIFVAFSLAATIIAGGVAYHESQPDEPIGQIEPISAPVEGITAEYYPPEWGQPQ